MSQDIDILPRTTAVPASLPPRVMQFTAPGRGAIAVLRVEGAAAVRIVEACFQPRSGRPLSTYEENRLLVGRFGCKKAGWAQPTTGEEEGVGWAQPTTKKGKEEVLTPPTTASGVLGTDTSLQAQAAPGEEVVVRRCPGGSVEICCHGGPTPVARIMGLLEKAGCQVVTWQTEAARSEKDAAAVAILEGLTQARTERTAAILLDQYHGAFDRATAAIRQAMEAGDSDGARRQLDRLLELIPLGRHLVRPWRVVLGGPVNVGKSSLVNALVGYGRSIVHDMPGTTRDAVTATTAVDGWPIELCDTAGLHSSKDPVESIGIRLAEQRMADADLAVLVFDHSMIWTEANESLMDRWPQALVVFNKCDLPRAPGTRPSGCAVSAREGQGLDEFLAEISHRLTPNPPSPGMAVPFGDCQVETLRRLAAAFSNPSH